MKRITLILAFALTAVALIGPASATAAPPDIGVKIGLPNVGAWAKTLPSMTFTTKGAGLSKSCSLSGPNGYYEFEEMCSSPYRPGEVTVDGDYVYGVTVEDGERATASDSVAFHVDQTAPTVTFTSAPPEGLLTNASIVAYNAAYADPNLSAVTCRLNSDPPTACGEGGAIQMQYTGLGEGPQKLSISATDKSGNTGYAERNITIDKTYPTASIMLVGGAAESADNTPSFVVSGADTNGQVTKKCRIENQIDWTDCNSGTWVTPDAIADGFVTAWLEVTDRAGNSTFASYGFTLDSTMPSVTITGVAGDRTENTTPTLSFAVDDLNQAGAKCGFDPAGWDQLTTCTEYESQTPAAALAVGTHQFWVAASDTFGNVASAIYTFEVVAPPPAGGGQQPGGGQNGQGGQGGKPAASSELVSAKARSGKVRRGKFTVLVTVTATGAAACERVNVKLAPKIKRAKSINAKGQAKASGAGCVAKIKIKLPAKFKQKRAALSVTHAGASSKATIKL